MKKYILTFAAITIMAVGAVFPAPVAMAQEPGATPASKPAAGGCSDRLLTFPAWYRGIQNPAPDCTIKGPSNDPKGISITAYIWKIVLNLVEILLQLVGYAALAYLIWGGYKYMLATGDSGSMSKAKQTILNAIIGLVISMLSIGIVNVVAGALK